MIEPAVTDRQVDAASVAILSRTFKAPVLWGFVPGPAFLESVGGALAAADLWLGHTTDDLSVASERMMMMSLRTRLAAVPQDPTSVQVREVMESIKTMVDFASGRNVVRLSDNAAG